MNEKEKFDVEMRKILSVTKSEMQKRLDDDKKTRDDNPTRARLWAAMKRPTRKSEL
jgi:hypothetical protein